MTRGDPARKIQEAPDDEPASLRRVVFNEQTFKSLKNARCENRVSERRILEGLSGFGGAVTGVRVRFDGQ